MSNLYFPQLPIGSIAQYPIQRAWSKPIRIDTLPDGTRVVMSGAAPARTSWTLKYSGLSDTEWSGIASLFDAVLGRSQTFTFLDPTDNLLAWSDDLTTSVWSADPLLHITGGVQDPAGGARGYEVVNSGQAPQTLGQSIAGPGWFCYCFSVYVRADAQCLVTLVRRTDSGEARETRIVGSKWTRISTAGALSNHDDGITFGIELPAAAGVMVYGPQVEPQPAPGTYKPTLEKGGVYKHSRFDRDVLTQTAEAAGQYWTTLRISASY